MSFCRLFPRPLAVCFALSLLAVAAQAQSATRPRQAAQATTVTNEAQGRPTLENDIVVVETAPDGEDEPEPEYTAPRFGAPGAAAFGQVERSMLTAIEQRLGTPYRMGATGPN